MRLSRESLTLLTGTLRVQLAEALAAAKKASDEVAWVQNVVGPLRVVVSDLVAGIERRQRGLDAQQEEVQAEIANLLSSDWFKAVDRRQSLMDTTTNTLRELNEVLLRDTHHFVALLQKIQVLATSAGSTACEETVQRVIGAGRPYCGLGRRAAVGQTLALTLSRPRHSSTRWLDRREVLLQRLSGLLGTAELVRTLNPRKRKYDERVPAETVRAQIGEALRRLAELGFIDIVDDDRLRLRPALMRFAEPVRGLQDAQAALERTSDLTQQLNRRTAAALTAPHSKATLTDRPLDALGNIETRHDGSVRLRPPHGLLAGIQRV